MRVFQKVQDYQQMNSELIPSDFNLFKPLNKCLAGTRFATYADLRHAHISWLKTLDTNFLHTGIATWRQSATTAATFVMTPPKSNVYQIFLRYKCVYARIKSAFRNRCFTSSKPIPGSKTKKGRY